MAITCYGDRARSLSIGGGKRGEMTVEEFRRWLMKFDVDKDGRISQKELRHAIRSSGGGWLSSGWKSGRAMAEADADGSGYIDEAEIDSLLDFAEAKMGFKFYY